MMLNNNKMIANKDLSRPEHFHSITIGQQVIKVWYSDELKFESYLRPVHLVFKIGVLVQLLITSYEYM